MRFARIYRDGREGVALADGDSARALFDTDALISRRSVRACGGRL